MSRRGAIGPSPTAIGVRYGYRRVYVILDCEGWDVNIKMVYNVYRAPGLQLRNKTPKRRVKAKLRNDRAEAIGPNDVWAMDFVHDQLAVGKKLRILTIVDTHSRYCPAADVRFQYRGEDVVQTLERICTKVGYPKTIRVDNGTCVVAEASSDEDSHFESMSLKSWVDQAFPHPLPHDELFDPTV